MVPKQRHARNQCAESGIKDIGVIGVDSGWEIYLAGHGGIETEVARTIGSGASPALGG